MLKNVKVGDRVRSCLTGWGTVVAKMPKDFVYPITIKFDNGTTRTFNKEGKRELLDENPEIVEVRKQEWEPEGGQKIIRGRGSINEPRTVEEKEYYRKEGRAYPSYELAKKAYSLIRPYQRLVAYVLGHAPNYESDWEDYLKKKWYVGYDHRGGKYRADCCVEWQPLIQVFMPKEVAVDLAKKLNSSEVKL